MRFVLGAGAVLVLGLTASAQTGKNYNVQTMNFDLWCQEEAHLPADRCDQRTPEDEKIFEAYRDKIERYEIPYLQEKSNEANFERNVLHNDPIDRPLKNDSAQQQQDPNQPPRTPPP
ncbi:MAG TPA: hypothetical protein VHV26_02235 [Rhizomicrobium sp.]|nr:hypothetical protein [Rhizomicrobium sp.]